MAPVSRPIVSILWACLNARSRASCAATSSAVIRSPFICGRVGGVKRAAALGTWVGAVGDKSLWVACRFDPSRLHVARVRSDVPAPPPAGIERRSPERLVLELAGLSLGALERIWAVADQATGYLFGALALL